MKITGKISLLLLGIFLLFAGTAFAHVTVSPAETKQNAYEVFTIRVPTEKEVATTRIELKFPESVSISRVQPLAGWKYEFAKNANGDNTAITWTAQGAGLVDGEFAEFKIQGKVADDAKDLVWKAYQKYADGSTVEWVGGAGATEPAPVTKVVSGKGANGEDHHGATASNSNGEVAASHSGDPVSTSFDWLYSPTFYLALIALAAGLAALSFSLRNGSRIVSLDRNLDRK